MKAKLMGQVASTAERICTHPLFGGITAVVGVIAGVIAGIYPGEIKDSFLTPCLWKPCSVSWWATWFWILVAVFGVCFAGTQWAQIRANSRATHALQSLVTRIFTLPPEGFLAQFQALFEPAAAISVATLLKANPVASKAEVEKAIRFVLGNLATLARHFDGNPHDSVYSANIMLYRDRAQLKQQQAVDRIKGILRFTDVNDHVTSFPGVLELVQVFSTTTNAEDYSPDLSVPSLALPVPEQADKIIYGKKKYKVLPGAPWAFKYRQYASFPTIETFINFCKEHCDFAAAVIEAIETYFASGDGSKVKSFASLRLIPPTASGDKPTPVGIVNIHRDSEGILTGRGQTDDGGRTGAHLFIPLTEPLRVLLVLLIETHERLDK